MRRTRARVAVSACFWTALSCMKMRLCLKRTADIRQVSLVSVDIFVPESTGIFASRKTRMVENVLCMSLRMRYSQ